MIAVIQIVGNVELSVAAKAYSSVGQVSAARLYWSVAQVWVVLACLLGGIGVFVGGAGVFDGGMFVLFG